MLGTYISEKKKPLEQKHLSPCLLCPVAVKGTTISYCDHQKSKTILDSSFSFTPLYQLTTISYRFSLLKIVFKTLPGQWFSTNSDFAPSGCFTMSMDIFDCPSWQGHQPSNPDPNANSSKLKNPPLLPLLGP